MAKLWQKQQHNFNSVIEKFETSDDLVYDNYLAIYDIYGSLAHAKMLHEIKIIDNNDLSEIIKGLNTIFNLIQNNEFQLEFGDEDIHSKVENKLTELIGEPAKKIHTGRSRNDQILLDIRLFTRSELLAVKGQVLPVIELLAEKAEVYKEIPMPGYTHMQKAMPSSVGMWFGSFAEALADDLLILDTAYEYNNQSPLGAGASYGVDLPLNRELTAKLLAFTKIQNNSLYTQNSKGKVESTVIFALMQIMFDISKMSADLLQFTTSEFSYFKVDNSLTTGSSIMPQKKNVDVAELLRAKIHIMHGYFTQVFTTVMNLPSGYNRDSQDTKKPFIESIDLIKDALEVFKLLIEGITPNTEVLEKAMTSELYATAIAYRYVREGMPFREAYKKVGEELDNIGKIDPVAELKSTTHEGSTGNLRLNVIHDTVNKAKESLNAENEKLNNAFEQLLKEVKS